MAVGRPGIRRLGCPVPTNRQLGHVLEDSQYTETCSPVDYDIPVFRITSGARYSGVPHRVYVSPVTANVSQPVSQAEHG